MKERTDTIQIESGGLGSLAPGSKHVYYTQLNMEKDLLHTAEQGGWFGYSWQ